VKNGNFIVELGVNMMFVGQAATPSVSRRRFILEGRLGSNLAMRCGYCKSGSAVLGDYKSHDLLRVLERKDQWLGDF
jgi:hypothetical protein